MLKNFYIIAFRNLLKNKTYSIINIFGLSLGITSALVVFLLITFLLSYDRYHQNFDRVYRVITENSQRGRTGITPGVPIPLPFAMEEDFTGLEKVVLISQLSGTLVDIEHNSTQHTFREDQGFGLTNSDYFSLFDRAILHGSKRAMLSEPHQAVISKSFAEKYFGNENAVGQTLTIDKKTSFTVSAVMEDYPINTDFPFDVLLSFETFKEQWIEFGWGSVSSDDQCYVLLEKGKNQQAVEAQFPAFVKKYFEDHKRDNRVMKLEPLAQLHFNTEVGNFSFQSVSMANIYALSVVGLFLLITCCINFINLTTAVAVKRSKEMGIRKVLGSNKSMLIRQLLGETGIITLIAILLSLGLTEAALIPLRDFLDIGIPFSFFGNPLLPLFILLLWIVVTLLSGFYPSQVMASYHPIEAIKNKLTYKGASGGSALRKVLIVFQFVISQAFIMATLIVLQQMDFFNEQDLGFDKEAIISVNIPSSTYETHQTFQRELERLSGVAHTSLSSKPPTSGSVSVYNIEKPGVEDSFYPHIKTADANYGTVYGLTFIAGNFYRQSDSLSGFVINEKMAKILGYDNPADAVGEELSRWGQLAPITGVTKDFHTLSLRNEIDPTIIVIHPDDYEEVAVKLASTLSIKGFLGDAEKAFLTLYPGYPFEYHILDEQIAEFYESEQKTSTILKVASIIAIIISLMGLYGLISFISEVKTKEIGVRKVLGASFMQVIHILLKDLVALLVIAFVIAVPLVWWGMDNWLNNFVYHITLSWKTFVLGGLSALLIAIGVASTKAWRTARINPSHSLRSE